MDTKLIAAEQLYNEQEYAEVEVSGSCMDFLFKNGETVIIRKTAPENIFTGDIVVFRQDRDFVIHRLIYKYTRNGIQYFLTKGDLKNNFDNPVQADMLLGKAFIIECEKGTINMLTVAGRLFSWFTFIYSSAFLFSLYIFDRIVSLVHGISNILGAAGFPLLHNKLLNSTAGLFCNTLLGTHSSFARTRMPALLRSAFISIAGHRK